MGALTVALFNGSTKRLLGWVKGRIDAALDPDRNWTRVESELEEEEEEEPVVSLRFKVTVPPTTPDAKDGRVLFLYGRDETEARSRLPAALAAGARFEPAGYSQDGVLHLPDEEVRACMASTQDERVAPDK